MIFSKQYIIPFLSAFLWAPYHAQAEQDFSDDWLDDQAFLTEMPVVLSASRLKQSITNAPAPVTIINRTMIDAAGAIELTDALRLVPGFQVGHEEGQHQTATYHGLSDQQSNRMQILIDGRSVYNPGFSGVTWNTLPITIGEIDRIEVVRGPNAASYGSNTFLGVINIITRHSIEDSGVKFNLITGSNNKQRVNATIGENIGNFDFRIVAEYDHDNGFDARHDSHHYRTLNFRGDYSATDKDTFLLKAGIKNLALNTGFDDSLVEPARDRNDDYNYQQLTWTHILADNSSIQATFYHDVYTREDSYNTPPLSDILGVQPEVVASAFGIADQSAFVDFGGRMHRYDGEIQHTFDAAADIRMVWGGGIRYESSSKNQYLTHDVSRVTSRIFANGEWELHKQLVVNAGFMLEHIENHGAHFSPRLSLNYHITPKYNIRTSVSRAYRTPSFFEQNAFFHSTLEDRKTVIDILNRSPLDIESEKIDAFEIGFIGELFNHKSVLDINIYHHRLSNLISTNELSVVDFDGRTDDYDNTGQAIINGVDAQIRVTPNHRSLINIAYSYANLSGNEFDDDVLEPLDRYVPEHTLSILGAYRFPNQLKASAVYYFNDNVTWRGNGDTIPSFTRLDLKLGKDFLYDSNLFSANLIIQNVLDNQYTDFRDENLFERRVFLQFGVKIQ